MDHPFHTSGPDKSAQPLTTCAEKDARLAMIIEDLLQRTERGEEVNFEATVTQNTDLAEDLRHLWATARIAAAVAAPGTESRLSSAVETPTFELPRQFGSYLLLEELGRGGMGIVFRAEHLSLKREVAIKMLLRGPYASSEDLERFTQEARSVARLDHPNIVSIFEFGEHEGRLYYSMPIVEGETLASRLSRGPLPLRRAAKILATVARAIEHAHAHGVLHRDLKPSNILIARNGEPHITDFGLARPPRESMSITKSGAILGTPAFMSPEQAAGDNRLVGRHSDVYSLGGILYHMITGQPPFEARSPVELMMMVIEQEPLPPRRLNVRISKPLERIVLRCLQKPIDLRYGSAAELADDLAAFLRSESVAATQVKFSQILSRRLRATHHAAILDNWGGLWMLNGIALFVVSVVTQSMQWAGCESRWPYFLLWTIGLGTWATVFWSARRTMGPVTFVERQIAHVWAAGLAIIFMLIPLEFQVGLPMFTMAPILGAATGVSFLVKAGSLSGTFYFHALALFLTSFLMAQWPSHAFLIYGIVAGASFFIPGLRLYRQQSSRDREAATLLNKPR